MGPATHTHTSQTAAVRHCGSGQAWLLCLLVKCVSKRGDCFNFDANTHQPAPEYVLQAVLLTVCCLKPAAAVACITLLERTMLRSVPPELKTGKPMHACSLLCQATFLLLWGGPLGLSSALPDSPSSDSSSLLLPMCWCWCALVRPIRSRGWPGCTARRCSHKSEEQADKEG